MRKLVALLLLGILLSGCQCPMKKWCAPGQVQKATGYNPASGKVK
ncbi:MAG: hypothetical protein ABIH47_02575 [Candidatus Omnitrophota bacterium]